jgi:hypothetical protein
MRVTAFSDELRDMIVDSLKREGYTYEIEETRTSYVITYEQSFVVGVKAALPVK